MEQQLSEFQMTIIFFLWIWAILFKVVCYYVRNILICKFFEWQRYEAS